VTNEPTVETLFSEMKRYVRFTDDDALALAGFGGVARPHFARIAEEFYDRIREHEDAHAVFTGEAQIERLKRSLVRWMERLCAGPHDEAYFLERAKIGRIHVKIGLPQRYMFTAMALIRASFEGIAAGLPRPQAEAARGSLARILDLELAIMMETYREDFVARLQRVERNENERLRRELERSEHRYISAVELARVLVVGLDSAGCVALFNHEAERVSGYARDEVMGRSFSGELLPEALRAEESALLLAAAAGELPPDGVWEVPLLTRAGRERMVRWQLAYAAPAADEPVALYAIGQDVTEERALQERTRQSERLAAVGTLAAGLAHEIRNPLNGALLHVTYLERALRRSAGSDDALETTRFIGTEIQRLSALVRDFLVFARPSPPNRKPASLRALCLRALTVVADDARRARADLSTDFAGSDIVMDVDGDKLEQVLLNLLRNAIDAVEASGGGRVVLRMRRQPRNAIVEVEDDGPGLPSADAPIFDAFYSTKAHGTGLGLAIVHRVVSDHGGTVEVESRAGCTVFRVALPIGSGATEVS
jgi:PAS domain S-box-containing protein